jgi:hypothetical protein
LGQLYGGAGIDTADYSASAAGVSVNLATGAGLGGDAEGDTLISIEHVIGSAFADTFHGGTDRGQFIAGDGNDTMTGGSVYDWLEGGKGNDTFIGTGGSMVMFGGDGNDKMTGSLDNYNYIDGGLGDDVMIGGNSTDYMADVAGATTSCMVEGRRIPSSTFTAVPRSTARTATTSSRRRAAPVYSMAAPTTTTFPQRTETTRWSAAPVTTRLRLQALALISSSVVPVPMSSPTG